MPNAPADRLGPDERTVVSADGTRIAMTVVGSGPALVLVPGAFDHRTFGPFAELAAVLSEQFSVAYYDRRGRGGSGDTAPYAIGREVEDLRAVIDGLGGSALAIGICSGAGLVLSALAAGAPISRAVVWEPPYRVESEGIAHEDRLRTLLESGRKATAVRFFLTRVLGLTWARALAIRSRPAVWRGLLDAAPTLPREVAIMNGLSIPERTFASIAAPVLVTVGSASPDWMKLASLAVVQALHGSAHTVLQDQTHDVDPVVLAPVATTFLLADRQASEPAGFGLL
jgi:pimeloyl-ACP methyl ester carboxylesterase